MKFYFLSTFCVFLAVMGSTGRACADSVASIPTNQSVGVDESSQFLQGNLQATILPLPGMTSLESATHDLVNRYRQFKNLPPLQLDPAISAQAKAHSEAMARSGTMSHDGFEKRTDSVSQTIVYRKAAENVAHNMGYAKPDLIAVQGWIESPGHRRNLIGQYDLTGIGVAKNAKGEYFFTQIFVRKAWYVKDAD
jgi:uncharacterized protein YkwD